MKDIAELTKKLGDKDSNIRRSAAEALGLMSDERAIDSLIPVLKDKNRFVRQEAILALRKIGGSRSVEHLTQALDTEKEEFVRLETTFRFDGIPETLEVTSTTSVGNGWQFTIEFDSRHAGYGNRSGQVLAQVITHHTAELTVEGGLGVTKAIMDEVWDMVNQRMLNEV